MPTSLKNINAHTTGIGHYQKVILSVACVIFGFDENGLKVLLTRSKLDEYNDSWTLLGDFVLTNEDPDIAAYRVLYHRTGLKNVFLEQVYTFGRPERHPSGRIVTIAYYALVNMEKCKLAKQAREVHWHSVKGIRELAFDHKEIFESCFNRLQETILNSHIGFNLLPPKFSLRQLQDVYESILGKKLDRRNFRKKMLAMDIIKDLDEIETDVSHRPGKLYSVKKVRMDKLL